MSLFLSESLRRFDDRPSEECRRLFHGRGHFYPGLEHVVVNWFPPFLQVINYEPKDRPISHKDLNALCAGIKTCKGLVLQTRESRRVRNEIIFGDVPEEHVIFEFGQKYLVKLLSNQNVGLFLDMGHVRSWLSSRVDGKKILNLFSYTCAFSVSALSNGASAVVNVDMSKNAISWGTANHRLNGQDLRKVTMFSYDIFKSWSKIKKLGPYGVVIIDPPTNQGGSFNAEKQYGQILKRVPDIAGSGSVVLACLNSPFLGQDFILRQVSRWCPHCQLIEKLDAHPDFPDLHPERGLKVLAFKYRA